MAFLYSGPLVLIATLRSIIQSSSWSLKQNFASEYPMPFSLLYIMMSMAVMSVM